MLPLIFELRGKPIREAKLFKQKLHNDHKHRAFEQVALYCGDRLVAQHGAVVNGDRLHALWHQAVNLDHFLVYRPENAATILTDQHECSAEHHLAVVVSDSPARNALPINT